MGNDHWAPKMKEKVKGARLHLQEVKKSLHLNQPAFYHKFEVKNRWERIAECLEEREEYLNTNVFLQ